MFTYLCRETVQKERVIFAIGIQESGNYKILGFYMNSVENHIAYGNVLMDMQEKAVIEPLSFITDGLPVIDEEIRQLYPRSDFQIRTIL